LMDEAQYVNGKRHGTHKSYSFRAGSDGDLLVRMLSRTAKYEHGKLNGIVKSYCGGSTPYPGSLSVWEFYVNGQVRERSCMTGDGFEDKCTRYQTQGETTEDWNGNEKPYSTGISRCSSSQ